MAQICKAHEAAMAERDKRVDELSRKAATTANQAAEALNRAPP
ncbi:hypothetical protein PSN_3845 [Pseudomonas sp. NGC7]